MALNITVAPQGDGWTIRSDAFDNDLVFQSGGRAETAARSLADRWAAAGRTTEVEIYLRDGAQAGRFVHPAKQEMGVNAA